MKNFRKNLLLLAIIFPAIILLSSAFAEKSSAVVADDAVATFPFCASLGGTCTGSPPGCTANGSTILNSNDCSSGFFVCCSIPNPTPTPSQTTCQAVGGLCIPMGPCVPPSQLNTSLSCGNNGGACCTTAIASTSTPAPAVKLVWKEIADCTTTSANPTPSSTCNILCHISDLKCTQTGKDVNVTYSISGGGSTVPNKMAGIFENEVLRSGSCITDTNACGKKNGGFTVSSPALGLHTYTVKCATYTNKQSSSCDGQPWTNQESCAITVTDLTPTPTPALKTTSSLPPSCQYCSADQTCVGRSDSSADCVPKDGRNESYCGKPDQTPNNDACASKYCDPKKLICAATPNLFACEGTETAKGFEGAYQCSEIKNQDLAGDLSNVRCPTGYDPYKPPSPYTGTSCEKNNPPRGCCKKSEPAPTPTKTPTPLPQPPCATLSSPGITYSCRQGDFATACKTANQTGAPIHGACGAGQTCCAMGSGFTCVNQIGPYEGEYKCGQIITNFGQSITQCDPGYSEFMPESVTSCNTENKRCCKKNPVASATPTPTAKPTPSPTPAPGSTQLALSLNQRELIANPVNKNRQVTVLLTLANGQTVTKTGTVSYANGKFSGIVNLGVLATEEYKMKVKFGNFLKSPIINLSIAGTNSSVQTTLVAGLTDEDNIDAISYFNGLKKCFGTTIGIKKCDKPEDVDLNGDGNVNFIDYQIYLKGIRSLQQGLPVQ